MKIKLKKGLALDIAGAIEGKKPAVDVAVSRCAVQPADFPGFMPKLEVKEGDRVAAGQPLLRDKNHENVKIVSPMAGVVKAVVRGERRKIVSVEVEADGTEKMHYDTAGVDKRDKAVDLLCRSGMLSRMRQRPYDIVPNPDVVPRDIFVTAIDLNPLSPGLIAAINPDTTKLQKAVKLLAKITDGDVYISTGKDYDLGDIDGAVMVDVVGDNPVGNVGVQVANIKPVNKGETVWTLDIVTLYKIGELIETGNVDSTTVVALTGSEVTDPHMISTTEGACIAPLVDGQLATDSHIRIISGNVLTGTATGIDGYLHFPYRQITVIPEGDDVAEFMGWASISPKKMSVSRSFPGHFFGKLFRPDARVLGGRRAMIMSGEYDKVMPMDILPEYLLKAIISKDIDAMEKLGIYEVAPEDFALAEYVDTSKQPLQQIVREGLDYLRKELE